MSGYVYLLCDSSKNNTYKIGATRGNIEKRIKKLQTGNSGEIYLCKYYKTEYPFFIESYLHKSLKFKKILNEWFELDDDYANNFINECLKIENLIKLMEDNPFFPKKLK